jgi:Cell Wall Hydrolase
LPTFTPSKFLTVAAIVGTLATPALTSCALVPFGGFRHLSEKECLVRAMYFESNRSSDEGLLAVGTVVMNRLESGTYPRTICGVVGQPGQFAAGVLDSPMSDLERTHIEQIADAILAGQRHRAVGRAMFFHTAGVSFPYRNMHYVLVAGGNAFYEKVYSYNETSSPTAMGTDAGPSELAGSDRLSFFLTTGEGL